VYDLAALAHGAQRAGGLDRLSHRLDHPALPVPGLTAVERAEILRQKPAHSAMSSLTEIAPQAARSSPVRSKNPRSISASWDAMPRSTDPSSHSSMHSPSCIFSSATTT